MENYFNLATHPSLMVLEYKSEAEWHKMRKEGIGGSDVAAVMKLSKYTSPLKVYNIKKGNVEEDLSDNVYIKKGKDLEALIRDKYVAPYMYERGYTVRHPEFTMVNTQFPWLRANVDGIAIPTGYYTDYTKNVIIEIKWVSEWAEVNWFGDEYCGIPVEYYAQVQHYMLVTGAKKAIVCALFDKTWTMHYFEIPFNAKFASELLDTTKYFYTRNLLADNAPDVVPSLDTKAYLDKLSKTSPSLVKDATLNDVCAEYLDLSNKVKDLNKRLDDLKDTLYSAYSDGKEPSEYFFVGVTTCSRCSIDSDKLKKEYREVYDKCQKVSEFPRLTVKKANIK